MNWLEELERAVAAMTEAPWRDADGVSIEGAEGIDVAYSADGYEENNPGIVALRNNAARLIAVARAAEAIIDSAEDGRPVPEWLNERLEPLRAALAGEEKAS